MLSRRGFFGALAALVVAPRLRCVPAPPPQFGLAAVVAASPLGTVGGIDAATFSFWRNQQFRESDTANAFDALIDRQAAHG